MSESDNEGTSRSPQGEALPSFTSPDALRFVLREWDRIWTTKSSLEQRAIALITTSGALVTLVFGFVAAVAKGQHFGNFNLAEKLGLAISLFSFAASALIALYTNMPKAWHVPMFPDLLGIEVFQKSEIGQVKPIDRLAVAMAEDLKLIDEKALQLAGAFIVQLFAIAVLAVVVIIVVA